MIINFKCSCGNTDLNKTKEYKGALGYSAIICACCGRYYDYMGEHLTDWWSEYYISTETNLEEWYRNYVRIKK